MYNLIPHPNFFRLDILRAMNLTVLSSDDILFSINGKILELLHFEFIAEEIPTFSAAQDAILELFTERSYFEKRVLEALAHSILDEKRGTLSNKPSQELQELLSVKTIRSKAEALELLSQAVRLHGHPELIAELVKKVRRRFGFATEELWNTLIAGWNLKYVDAPRIIFSGPIPCGVWQKVEPEFFGLLREVHKLLSHTDVHEIELTHQRLLSAGVPEEVIQACLDNIVDSLMSQPLKKETHVPKS